MNTIIYLKDVPLFKKVLGFTFLFLGLFAFTQLNLLFGAIFITLGLNFLIIEGSQIDLDNNTYRSVKSLFGSNFGKWKPCPQFDYVSVFKTKENQTVRMVTAEATVQYDIILLNLFYNKNKHITFYKTQDKSDAFLVAEKFKSIFNIDILDATSKDKKWL